MFFVVSFNGFNYYLFFCWSEMCSIINGLFYSFLCLFCYYYRCNVYSYGEYCWYCFIVFFGFLFFFWGVNLQKNGL